MIKHEIKLIDGKIRPTFVYKDKYIKQKVDILYDTGAVISLWCGDEESLKSTFRCKDTGLVMEVTGIGNYGKECNIYLITLIFGNFIIMNVPIAVYEGAEQGVDIILSRTIFKGINKIDVDNLLILTSDIKSSHHFNMLEPIAKNGIYLGVKCNVISGVCPICGYKLLDNGKCMNINCDFDMER